MVLMRNSFILILFIGLCSCYKNDIYDRIDSIPSHGWTYGDTMSYAIVIKDTNAHYQVYINVRHKAAYPYSNLWVKLITKSPLGHLQSKDLSLPLAAESGEWYGTSISDIISHKILIQNNAIFQHIGTYEFRILQNSRDSLLIDILDIGIRLEKVKQQ